MSNCSDDDLLCADMLGALAAEANLLGRQIEALGEGLSEHMIRRTDPFLLQQFDRLAQTAHAQAQMIAFIAAGQIAGEARNALELDLMTAAIPLVEMRDRLRLLLGFMPEEPQAGEDFWPETAA